MRSNLIIMFLAAIFLLGIHCGQQRKQDARRSSEANVADEDIPALYAKAVDKVARIVSDGSVREYVLCNIHPAFWGGFNTEVRVGASTTVDGKPRVFRVERWSLFEEVDTNGISGLAETKSGGLVLLDSREKAFKRGIPFFLTDVAFRPPDVLSYTVISNLGVRMSRVMARLRSVERGFNLEVLDSAHPFASDSTPQKRVWRGRVDTTQTLSIVSYTADEDRCLVSNEVPLADAVRSAAIRK